MNLYRTASGSWAGTQVDARIAAKDDGGRYVAVDVPTDKPSLLAFLNLHRVGAPVERTERLEAPPVAPTPPASPAPSPAVPETVAKLRHDISVEEEIAKADFPSAIRLADHCLWRLTEHVREAEKLRSG